MNRPYVRSDQARSTHGHARRRPFVRAEPPKLSALRCRLFPRASEWATVGSVKPRVYLETSVVSYLVGRLSRDVIVLGNQELTREWWAGSRADYEVFVSEVVLAEVAGGDSELARQRLLLARDVPLLHVTEEAEHLAPLLLRAAGLAANASTDALHM